MKGEINRILEILEGAKDENGCIPMALVRRAFKKLERRWIPCSERLPNDDKPVLLTEELRLSDSRRRRDVCMASYDSQNMTWYEILGANTLEITYPIAWMELPEPQQDE